MALEGLHNAVAFHALADKYKHSVKNPVLKRVLEDAMGDKELTIFADETVRKIWTGFAFGAIRELEDDGLGGIAQEVIFNAKK